MLMIMVFQVFVHSKQQHHKRKIQRIPAWTPRSDTGLRPLHIPFNAIAQRVHVGIWDILGP